MVQLWRLVEGPTSKSTSMRDHELVYIRPYINSHYRGFYLCPNFWKIKSFESLKVLGGPPNPRLIVNIFEDDSILKTRKENLTSYNEEIVLPVTRDANFFDSNTFEGACQALYFLNIDYLQRNDGHLIDTGLVSRGL